MTSQSRPNPYVGPRPFQTGENLYGRDQEIMDLLDLLIAERIALLYSPSGAGKTSLIQAGLIPELAQEDFQVLPVMRVSLEPPPDQSVENIPKCNRYVLSLLLSLEEGLPADQQLSVTELAGMTLAQYLEQWQQGVSNLDLTAKSPISADGSASPTAKSRFSTPEDIDRVVLIFDQFEEILTVDSTDRPAKTEFFEQIGAALRHSERWALFSMREEFPAGLDPYLRAIPTRLSTTFRLELLGEEAACQAMQEPASQAGVPFTNIAADKLIDDLRQIRVQQPDGNTIERAGLYIEPVQLQVVCHRLWTNLPEDANEIQEVDIQEAGDVDNALAGYYADQIGITAQQTGVRERMIREWFDQQLITEQGIRGQVLRGPEQSQGLANQAIEPLVDAHLVRAENRRGAIWYELAHDRLIEPIRKNNAGWFQTHLSTLQRQAALWESQNRPNGLLLQDEALEEAEDWATAHQDDLLPEEHDFLQACLETRERVLKERRTNRLIRRLFMGAIIATIVAMTVAVFAYLQRAEAERLRFVSIAQSLSVQALYQQRSGQSEVGALLARQAYLFNRKNRGTLFSQIDNTLRSVLKIPYFSHVLRLSTVGVSLAMSPDGQMLASGNDDGTIHVWDLSQPASSPTILQGHRQTVWSVVFSYDGKALASGSADKTVRLWDVDNSGSVPLVFSGHKGIVFSVAISPDKQTLASGSLDGTVRVWDVQHPDKVTHVFSGHVSGVNSVAFSPDGSTIVSGSSDKTVRLWDLQTQTTESRVFQGHEAGVNSVAFSPDGQVVASGSADKTIRLWPLYAPEVPVRILRGHKDQILSIAFALDGKRLISGSWDKTVRLWDLHNLSADPYVLHGHDDRVFSIASSVKVQALASVGNDQTVRFWNVNRSFPHTVFLQSDEKNNVSRREGMVRTLLEGRPLLLPVFDDVKPIKKIIFRDRQTLLSLNHDGTVLLWDVNNPANNPSRLFTLNRTMTATAFSPDGQTLALGSNDGSVHLWDINKPDAEPIILSGHTGSVRALAFSLDGRSLASGGEDKSVRIWDLKNLQAEPAILAKHEGPVLSIAFSPNGKVLASGTGNSVSEKNEDNKIRLWDLSRLDDSLRSSSSQRTPIFSLTFSPDGKSLASSSDKIVSLWNVASLKTPSLALHAHTESVLSIAFGPDGKRLASGGEDNSIRIWNLEHPKVDAIALQGHGGGVESVAFNLDGDTLASGSRDGSVILWKLEETLADEVCQKVWRNLTQDEWRQFVGEGVPYEFTCPESK